MFAHVLNVSNVLLFALVLFATLTDLARHKIYNWTTYPGLLGALALNLAGTILERSGESTERLKSVLGWVGLWESFLGLLACGLIMLAIYVLFRVGGGDVKLMAMMGAFLGTERGLLALLWTFVLGACLGLIVLVWRVGVWRLMARVGRQVVWSLRMRGWSPLSPEERGQLQPPLFLAPCALASLVMIHVVPM